jgi:SAM-dependent methyltransferase
MNEPVPGDVTQRFTGLADLYARHRPSYPPQAIDLIIDRAGLKPGDTVVDVGCGTGISSRLFAARGLEVVGIEPNDDMRVRAAAEQSPAAGSVVYRAGRAEATGLPTGCAALVLAAQAFHWFDPASALAEFHRLLRPGGWVALLWNERDETDPATAAYGRVLRTGPRAAAIEGSRARAGLALLHSALFTRGEEVQLQHEQALDEEGLLGRAFSASYAPRQPEAAARFADALRQVFRQFQLAGRVTLRYQTSVFLACRQDRSA